MHTNDVFLSNLALVFCFAALITVVFQRLRQPVVLGYLLVGLLVGPHTTAIPLFADHHEVEVLAELGVILVIFSIGLEFSLGRVFKLLPTAGLAGGVQIAAMLWLGSALGKLVGFDARTSMFLGGGLCISSTMIIAREFSEREVDPRVRDNVFGILVVQDLAAIVLIAVFTSIASGAGQPVSAVVRLVGELGLFLSVAVIVGILLVPRLVREADRLGSNEITLVVSLGICFGFALLAAEFGYSVALGAFLAGTLVSESGRRHRVELMVKPIRDMFAAVFFVSIGMMVDPFALVAKLPLIVLAAALIIVGQIVFASLGSLLAGKTVKVAVESGMSLAQIGEFSFIIVGIGISADAVPAELFAVIVGAAVLTTFTTPLLIERSTQAAATLEARLPRPIQNLAALYGAWFESIPGRVSLGGRTRQSFIWLGLDFLCLVAIVLGVGLGREVAAAELAARAGIEERVALALVVIVAVLVALPFALGSARLIGRLGTQLAASALPRKSKLDLADAPRRTFVLGLEFAIALLVLLPLLVISQPFLPLYVGAALLLIVVLVLGWLLWRQATTLDGHLLAGARLVLEVLERQRASDLEHESPPPAPHGSAPVLNELLPGLGPLTTTRLAATSPALDRTLADLDLRAATGAAIIAIVRSDGQQLGAPAGHDRLAVGDLLTLTGKQTSLDRALALLNPPEPVEPVSDSAQERDDDDD